VSGRGLRARVLWAEADALGVTIGDLVAVAEEAPAGASVAPTVAEYVEVVAASLSAGTAATYRSYWRLAVARLGNEVLGEVTPGDCEAVVADAVARAQRDRPGAEGRSSREGPHGQAPVAGLGSAGRKGRAGRGAASSGARELLEETGLSVDLLRRPAGAMVRAYHPDWPHALGPTYAAIAHPTAPIVTEPGQPVAWRLFDEPWASSFPDDIERIRSYVAWSVRRS
jgi:hypothetical protein